MARCVSFAHEVKAPSRHWQSLGPQVWDRSAQIGGQFWYAEAETQLFVTLPPYRKKVTENAHDVMIATDF